MSSTTAVCPRCHAEVQPLMARCRDCGQTLTRPTAAMPTTTATARMPDPVRVAPPSPQIESDTATAVVDRGTPSPANSEKIRITCVCGATIRVSVGLRGKRIKCPKCSTSLPVPITVESGKERPQQSVPPIERPSAVRPPIRAEVSDAVPASSQTGEWELTDEIESAAKKPVPQDSAASASGKLSSARLRKLRKQLEEANVLSDSDTIARRQSLLELGQSQDRQVLEILVEHAQDNSSVVRDGAVTALGELGDPEGVPTVLRALLDRNADVVRAAFAALKKIGDRRVVRPLLRYGIERPNWKPLANDTLVRLGSRVVPELLLLLQSTDPGLTLDAIVVLGRIGDKQTVPQLIACLDHFSNLLKAHLIEALALMGDPRAVPHLMRALDDSHVAIRANAAAGLARMADPRSLGPLLRALQDEDADVRGYAATALGELGEAKAIPELTRVLTAWESLVTLDAHFLEAVVEALGKLGDVSAVPDLIPLLQSQHDGVLLKTVLALKKLRDPSAAQALVALLHVPKPTVRRRVVETLGQTGDRSLVTTIGGVLRDDPAPEVRAAAARALGELKSKEAVPFLEEALQHEFMIRCQAVIALGAIHEKSMLPALMAMLKDSAPEVRYHAVNAIAKFKDKKTLRAIAVLLEDSDPMVRNGAAKVVEEFGQVGENKAVQEIIRRVRSRDMLARLIPQWIFLFVPRTSAARRTIVAVIAASLLVGFIIKSGIGGPNKVLVRGNVQALALSADGGTLVAERTLGALEVWDVNKQSVSLQVQVSGLRSPLFRAKDGVVLLAEGTLVPWSLREAPVVTAGWKEHKQPILQSATTPDGKFAVTMGKDLIAVVWDLEAGSKRSEVELDERFSAALTISPNGQWLATANRKGEAVVWEIESGKRLKEFPGPQTPRSITSLSISPDNNWLVGIEEGSGLRVWDLNASVYSEPKAFPAKPPLRAVKLQVLSDSQRVLTADVGGEVRIWQLDSGESRVVCSGDIEQLDGFALSADEKRFAIGGNSNSVVLIYELDSGDLLKRLDVKR